jgi:hypothetical protein
VAETNPGCAAGSFREHQFSEIGSSRFSLKAT